MSKVLVIPDVHLKPWMFDQAKEIMVNTDIERAVCVGDLVDDWNCEEEVDLYEKTLNKAIDFAKNYPSSLWCYGNHDLSYLWDQYDHPGYSVFASDVVCDMLETLRDTLESPDNIGIIHKVDNTLFSHAGLSYEFVEQQFPQEMDIECMIDMINDFGVEELWEVNSPIWVRPQDWTLAKGMFPDDLFQVVGHTPVSEVFEQDNMITVDTFSTYSNGQPVGNREFCWVDTVKKTWGYFE